MSSKRAVILALFVAGFPGLAYAGEESKRVDSSIVSVRSTATILSGVSLDWSSTTFEGIVTSSQIQGYAISRTVVRRPETREVIYYVDFS